MTFRSTALSAPAAFALAFLLAGSTAALAEETEAAEDERPLERVEEREARVDEYDATKTDPPGRTIVDDAGRFETGDDRGPTMPERTH